MEVRAPEDAKLPLFFYLQWLEAALPGVIVTVSAGTGGEGGLGGEVRARQGSAESWPGAREQLQRATRMPFRNAMWWTVSDHLLSHPTSLPLPRPTLLTLQGIPTVDRAVINRKENDKDKFHILVEGTNLQVGGSLWL